MLLTGILHVFCLQDLPSDGRGSELAYCELRLLHGPWDASARGWQAERIREGRQDSSRTALHDLHPENFQLRPADLWKLWRW